jgi:hypothetical protein
VKVNGYTIPDFVADKLDAWITKHPATPQNPVTNDEAHARLESSLVALGIPKRRVFEVAGRMRERIFRRCGLVHLKGTRGAWVRR